MFSASIRYKSQTLISSLIFLFFGLPTLFHRFSHDFCFTFLKKLNSSSISLFQFLIVDFYDFIIRVQIIISVSFIVFIQILIDFLFFLFYIYIYIYIVSTGTTRLQGSIQGIASIGCVGNVLLDTL